MNNNYKFSEEDYDVEIENIMKKQNMINEESMVYKDTTTYGGHAFSSKAEEAKYIKENCYVFFDETFAYIVEDDGMEDFAVYRMKKHHCAFQPDELEEDDSSSNSFEAFDVSFKIVSNRNEEVYVEGYVTINDSEAEDVDWYFWNGTGYQSRRFIFHDGISIKGSTIEQENELAQFESDLSDEGIWIDDVILQSDDTENRTYVRENLTLIINEGAKMECEIKEIETCWEYQYVVELIPRFNGELIDLAGFMDEKNIIFDPYGVGDDDAKFFIEEGHIYFEISKDWFEGDEEDKEDNLKIFINPEAENIYKQYLTSKLGVYSIASRIYEEEHGKLDESGCDKFANNWEQSFENEDVVELYSLTSEDVERVIKEDMQHEDD